MEKYTYGTDINDEMKKKIIEEFQHNARTIFKDNLAFGFIFGGIAKGYAKDFGHDIDMFICLKKREPEQEKEFQEFYFDLHKRTGFTADYVDPVEVTTYENLRNVLSKLSDIKINPIMKTYEEYEAIVWGDIFAAKVIAEVGDLPLLQTTKKACESYPDQWRRDIKEFIGQHISASQAEELDKLNITLLFEKYVTYLKEEETQSKILSLTV